MPQDMNIYDYLAQGGKLSTPANVPARYRGELMRIMATFVDSELAAAAGFADTINDGPGIKERIAAARIVLEKTDHADKVLHLMGEFGTNTERYAMHHPWTDRLPRDADPSAKRQRSDMRLRVLDYPLDGWTDAVVMNLLMGLAVNIQLSEFETCSYQPFAEAIREILPRERRHTELAQEGVERLIHLGETGQLMASVAYWYPKIAASFGTDDPARFQDLHAIGLRRTRSEDMRKSWAVKVTESLDQFAISQDLGALA